MHKTLELNKEEFDYLKNNVNGFLEKGSIPQEPQFVVVCGPVGTGKSTIRKKKFNKGFVLIDAGEVYLKLTNNESNRIEKLEGFIEIVGSLLTAEAIDQKRNIVIEVLMDNEQPIKSIIDKMVEKGYKVKLEYIHADPVTSWKRNISREKHNISSYHTQGQTMAWFSQFLGLEM